MIIGCGIFAYSMNVVGQLVQESREISIQTKKNLNIIQNYMNNKKISE